MTTYQDLVQTVRAEAHATVTELPDSEALLIVKGVVRDLSQRGVLIDLADSTIVYVTNTSEYVIPSPLLWVSRLEVEHASIAGIYEEIVPRWHYRFQQHAGAPYVEFFRNVFVGPANGKLIRFTGQSKITEPTALADTVLDSISGVAQEGLRVKVLSRLSMEGTGLAADRANQRREEKVLYEEFLAGVVAGRVRPDSIRVPGR